MSKAKPKKQALLKRFHKANRFETQRAKYARVRQSVEKHEKVMASINGTTTN
jgi:hypothetical protein